MEPSDQNGDSDHDALARATNDVDAAERDDTVSAGETVLHSTEIAVVDDQVFTQDGGADDDQNDDLDLTNLADELDRFQEHPLVKEALWGEVDMTQIDSLIRKDCKATAEKSIGDYVKESRNLASLHSDIRQCDTILATMESVLHGFQGDLATISDEICTLQASSEEIKHKLSNRKDLHTRLGRFVVGCTLDRELISNICDGEADEAFLGHLLQLKEKMDFAASVDSSASAAATEIEPEFEKLRQKAVTKVRTFLVVQVSALSNPKTNFQILQQSVLLKYGYFVHFLRHENAVGYGELKQFYVDTMSNVLLSHFRVYVRSLIKLQDAPLKTELLGSANEHDSKPIFGMFGKTDKPAPFQLGQRGQILNDVGKMAILIDVAEHENSRFTFEAIFRSMNQLLMDASSSEHNFVSSFFGDGSIARDVLAKTVALHLELLDEFINTSCDLFGLFLLIAIIKEHELTMLRRRVDCLDEFIARATVRLWQRLKAIFELSIESLRTAVLGDASLHSHVIIKRYAELAVSLSSLNRHDDSRLKAQLAILRNEAEKLIHRLAAQHSADKQRKVCLINNYASIVAAYDDRQLTSEDKVCFDERLSSEIAEYVMAELSDHYATLINFVKNSEQALSRDSVKGLAEMQQPLMLAISEEFSRGWKKEIQQMNNNVMANFSNFKNGMEILRQVLTELLLYYTRFLDLVKKGCKGQLPKDLVTIATLGYEVKQYLRTF